MAAQSPTITSSRTHPSQVGPAGLLRFRGHGDALVDPVVVRPSLPEEAEAWPASSLSLDPIRETRRSSNRARPGQPAEKAAKPENRPATTPALTLRLAPDLQPPQRPLFLDVRLSAWRATTHSGCSGPWRGSGAWPSGAPSSRTRWSGRSWFVTASLSDSATTRGSEPPHAEVEALRRAGAAAQGPRST